MKKQWKELHYTSRYIMIAGVLGTPTGIGVAIYQLGFYMPSLLMASCIVVSQVLIVAVMCNYACKWTDKKFDKFFERFKK